MTILDDLREEVGLKFGYAYVDALIEGVQDEILSNLDFILEKTGKELRLYKTKDAEGNVVGYYCDNDMLPHGYSAPLLSMLFQRVVNDLRKKDD